MNRVLDISGFLFMLIAKNVVNISIVQRAYGGKEEEKK